MRRFFWWLGVPVVTLVIGLICTFPLFVFGLFVPAEVVLPLTVGFATLYAALAAAWLGNLLSPSKTASRILPIVGVSELAAGILYLVIIALTVNLGVRWPFPIFPVLVIVLGVTLIASLATRRLRRQGRALRNDALTTLGLIALALLIAAGTLVITCSVTPCVP